MAITVGQIPQAIQTVGELESKLNDILMLLKQAKELADKNWQLDIGSRGSLIVTITPAQQASMIALYESYKTQLVSTFQNLP